MAYCKNCGQMINEGAAFCANCGAPVEAQPTQQQAVTPTVGGDADVQSNRGIAWLSYAGLLFLVPMLARKNSEYCRFHVKQGIALFGLEVAYTITKILLMVIIGAIFRFSVVYVVFNTLFNLVYILFTVLTIIGIVNAATGKKVELPIIGKIPFITNLVDKIVK